MTDHNRNVLIYAFTLIAVNKFLFFLSVALWLTR